MSRRRDGFPRRTIIPFRLCRGGSSSIKVSPRPEKRIADEFDRTTTTRRKPYWFGIERRRIVATNFKSRDLPINISLFTTGLISKSKTIDERTRRVLLSEIIYITNNQTHLFQIQSSTHSQISIFKICLKFAWFTMNTHSLSLFKTAFGRIICIWRKKGYLIFINFKKTNKNNHRPTHHRSA